MKIGIMSDTHDNLPQVSKAITAFRKEPVELIIHCGDWVSPFVPQFIYSLEPKLTIPVKSVFGNNEGDHFRFLERKEKEKWNIDFYKETYELELDGKKMIVYHGSSKSITASLIACKKYEVVLTGHTHEAVIETVNGVVHINPGSATGYAWGKITDKGSVVVYDTKTSSARLILLKDIA